jgi:hypothetical protein
MHFMVVRPSRKLATSSLLGCLALCACGSSDAAKRAGSDAGETSDTLPSELPPFPTSGEPLTGPDNAWSYVEPSTRVTKTIGSSSPG